MFETPLSYAMLSDPGRVRQRNEDACAADLEHGVFVVCDGVGGAAGGEIASELAAQSFLARVKARLMAGREARNGHETEVSAALDPDNDAEIEAGIEADLRDGFEFANRAVHRHSQERVELFGMATTMVAMVFHPHPNDLGKNDTGEGDAGETAGTVWLANVGDSRCYRLRGDRLEQLTQDHSLVGEQVRSGFMTRAEAEASPIRNVITRALGSDLEVEADVQRLEALPGEIFLLASDGLTRELSDEDVTDVLLAGSSAAERLREGELEGMCAELVRRANAKGGGDNITCLLVRIPTKSA